MQRFFKKRQLAMVPTSEYALLGGHLPFVLLDPSLGGSSVAAAAAVADDDDVSLASPCIL